MADVMPDLKPPGGVHLPEWAKKKLGPFPVWAYGAVGGGLLLALYLKGHPFTPGSAGTAKIGAPGSSAGLGAGAGLPPGTRPPSTLETSPPGSPQPPGRVLSSNFTPAHFVSQFRNMGVGPPVAPVPQVGTPGVLTGPVVGALPEPFGNLGNFDILGRPAYETSLEMFPGVSGYGNPFGASASPLSAGGNLDIFGRPSPVSGMEMTGPGYGSPFAGADIGIGNGTNQLSQSSYSPGVSAPAYAPSSSFVDLSGYQPPAASYSPQGFGAGPTVDSGAAGIASVSSPAPADTSSAPAPDYSSVGAGGGALPTA